jgi:hypothetical protein
MTQRPRPVRRWIEAAGIGIAVHFEEEPSPETIAAFEDLARWIAAHPESLRASFGEPVQLTEAEAAEAGDRQLRIERLRRRAGLE